MLMNMFTFPFQYVFFEERKANNLKEHTSIIAITTCWALNYISLSLKQQSKVSIIIISLLEGSPLRCREIK